MSHLDTFHAIRYRGIDGLRLDRLGKVNLITGPNGVGKTSLAEAVWLFNGRFTPVLPWNHVVQRSTHTGVDPLAALSAGVVELAGTERSVAHRWKARFETAPTTGAGPAPGNGSSRSEGLGAEAQPLPVPVRGQLQVWLDEEERESDVLTLTGPATSRSTPSTVRTKIDGCMPQRTRARRCRPPATSTSTSDDGETTSWSATKPPRCCQSNIKIMQPPDTVVRGRRRGRPCRGR